MANILSEEKKREDRANEAYQRDMLMSIANEASQRYAQLNAANETRKREILLSMLNERNKIDSTESGIYYNEQIASVAISYNAYLLRRLNAEAFDDGRNLPGLKILSLLEARWRAP